MIMARAARFTFESEVHSRQAISSQATADKRLTESITLCEMLCSLMKMEQDQSKLFTKISK